MSKLQELIDRLCPDGVEIKPLGALSEESVTPYWLDNSTTNEMKAAIL